MSCACVTIRPAAACMPNSARTISLILERILSCSSITLNRGMEDRVLDIAKEPFGLGGDIWKARGDRWFQTTNRELRAESREQRAESREQRAENREHRAESREQRAESKGQRAELKEEIIV